MLHTYVRGSGRPGPAHLLTYPPERRRGGVTLAHVRLRRAVSWCVGAPAAVLTIACLLACLPLGGDILDGEWVVRSAERAEECVHFLLRHCWVQRHDGGCRAALSGANAGASCASVRWSHPSTAAGVRRRSLTYFPPEPSALAGCRPYLLTPPAWCRTDLGIRSYGYLTEG